MMTDKAASIKEEEILNQAKMLILTVKESYQNGTAIHEVEKNLFEAVLKMGHQALGLLFELCGSGDVGQSVCLDVCHTGRLGNCCSTTAPALS